MVGGVIGGGTGNVSGVGVGGLVVVVVVVVGSGSVEGGGGSVVADGFLGRGRLGGGVVVGAGGVEVVVERLGTVVTTAASFALSRG